MIIMMMAFRAAGVGISGVQGRDSQSAAAAGNSES